MRPTRRSLMIAGLTFMAANPAVGWAQTVPKIHVIKGRGCGCCSAWASILKAEGFDVIEDEMHPADLMQLKQKKGVPQDLSSCHTAEIDGYVIEGHVPPADIRKLLSERPDVVGLSVPGMPYGSPGMGPESERETYNVLLIGKDGSSEVFTTYDAGS